MGDRGETILINLVKLRDGVDPDRFSEFAASLDLPVWRGKEVVIAFDTYLIEEHDRAPVGAEFIEVMRLRSLQEWEEVGQSDPDIEPLAAAFSELVDETRTRRIHVRAVPAGSSPQDRVPA